MPWFDGNLLTQRNEICWQENRDSRLSYGENAESLSHLGLNRYRVVTDGRTDRITIANYTRLAVPAVARKNWPKIQRMRAYNFEATPVGCALSSLFHSIVRVIIWGRSTPFMQIYAKYMLFRKSRFRWVQTHMSYFVVSGPKFTGLFFAVRERNRCQSLAFPFHSGDIRDRILKVSEVDLNFARFWPLNFFWEGTPNFSTGIIKLNTLAITWQSLAIGRGSSEISRWKNERKNET